MPVLELDYNCLAIRTNLRPLHQVDFEEVNAKQITQETLDDFSATIDRYTINSLHETLYVSVKVLCNSFSISLLSWYHALKSDLHSPESRLDRDRKPREPAVALEEENESFFPKV